MNTAAFASDASLQDVAATSRLRRRAWMLLLLGVGGFLGFAAWAPLDDAVLGSGTVGAAAQRRSVQPALAGPLAQLAVREGDRVRAGQVLMRVDTSAQAAELQAVQRQLVLHELSAVRLGALLQGAPQMTVPPALAERAQALDGAHWVREQQALFGSQRHGLMNEQGQRAARLAQLGGELKAGGELLAGHRSQRELVQEQLASQSALADQGFLPRQRVRDGERVLGQARLDETRAQADLRRTQDQLTEAQADSARIVHERRREWEAERLALAQAGAQLQARAAALRQALAQADVVAPVSGSVVGLAVHSLGAVVQAAQPVLDIVPEGDDWIVESRFPLAGGEKLAAGMAVDLRLVSADAAATPVLKGQVLTVSADRMEDARSGAAFLLVRVALKAGEAQRMAATGVALRAGLPVEVVAALGERSLLGQWLKPLTQRVARGLVG